MVVATDDLRDAHVVVVHDDGEHVGRGPVGAQEDEIVDVRVGEGDAALHGVIHHGLAFRRRLDADGEGHAVRRLGRIAVAPAAVVAGGLAGGALPLAHRVELLASGVAAVGASVRQKFLDDRLMALHSSVLGDRLAIPFDAEPRTSRRGWLPPLRRSNARGRCPRCAGAFGRRWAFA